MKTTKEKLLPDLNPLDAPMVRLHAWARELSEAMPDYAAFAETGTRSGHSALLLLDAIRASGKLRWLYTIDPYGDKPYGHGTGSSTSFDYGEQHYRNALASLSGFAWEHDLLHCHYRMRSQEFRFMAANVEFWWKGERQTMRYGLVYLDGEHTMDAVREELSYFEPRLVSGGAIVIDDVGLLGDVSGLLPGHEIYEGKLWWRKP